MEDPSSGDCLPQGWTVEVKVRKNGRRDKYYFSPSSGLKFSSKVEVFRHLENARNKVGIQRVADNVVVEKGLPAGSMKKTRITTKGDTVRRDSYYIDPASGYVFRSLRDVDRYLESGEIGRNAFKPKDNSDTELKADKFSPVSTTKPTVSVSMGLNSDSDRISNDQQDQKPVCSAEYASTPISENTSAQCVMGTKSTTLGSDQIEGKASEEDSQAKQLPQNEQMENEKSQKRQRRKKEINLPRRSSKRLAGIQLDPVPELVTRSRARRAAVKQSGQGETIRNEDKSSNSLPNAAAKRMNVTDGGSETKCKSESAANMLQSTKFSTPERLPNKTTEEDGSNKDQECFSFWPQENNATMKDPVLDYSHEFPLKELLQDPCIAFAIQTLTGETFEMQVSGESSEHSEALTANMGGDDKGGCNVFSHPENYAIIPQQHAGAAETAIKTNENQTGSSSSEKELDVSWMDPCIEFAIKTLTGSIPLDSEQNPKNCIQQQLSSSNTNPGDMAYKQEPMFKESFVDPAASSTHKKC
ncbi:hypothetical protein HN51_071630 [Arachis hypogaea]|uniref:uncharacterized protein LOC107644820 isoform X2 n=2 Tax=Arachis ipaensis TaxID=130454 RepID=UPI0007AF4335|nr:uncharacterized protein LOC107644820 isoform X2 [Arachis ipaensis]XP_025656813.1 uncharacterized protein LOC112751778 isoform X1 [Arachis hypogaea]QHO14243.1 Methyl-CpG-binding domain-containing protein [Arachis hypogaea]